MDLDKEKYDELPEFLKGEFEKVDGVYKSKDSLELAQVKQTANDLDSKAKQFESKYSELETRLSEYEQKKQEEIQRARDEALEQATSKGESDEIRRIYEEKMQDLEQRSYERGKQEAAQEFKRQTLEQQADSQAKNLASKLAADEYLEQPLYILLKNMIKADDEGVTFFDEQGGALSLTDVKEFETEVIKKSPMFKRLVKAESAVSGGGLASGGKGGGAVTKPLKEMNESERLQLKRDNPELFKQLLNS